MATAANEQFLDLAGRVVSSVDLPKARPST